MHRSTLVWCVPCVAALACEGSEVLPSTGVERTRTLHSDILDDDYLLRIRLPPGVAEDDAGAWPLVVQLDPTFVGLQEYAITTGLVSQRSADGDWPDAVVVGVDYDEPFGGRFRDYTYPDPLTPDFDGDGADAFYAVLRDEILPELDATLPVDPARRVLVGHSNGAMFAWYCAFRHGDGTAPLFAGLVAADGGVNADVLTLEQWHADRATDLPVHLYASRAFYNGATQKLWFDELTRRLEGRAFPSLHLTTEVFHTDHGGVLAPSFDAGLAAVLPELP